MASSVSWALRGAGRQPALSPIRASGSALGEASEALRAQKLRRRSVSGPTCTRTVLPQPGAHLGPCLPSWVVIGIWAPPNLVPFHSEKDMFPPRPGEPSSRTWVPLSPVAAGTSPPPVIQHQALSSNFPVPSTSHFLFPSLHRRRQSGEPLSSGSAPSLPGPLRLASAHGVGVWGCLAQGRDLVDFCRGLPPPQELPSLRSPVASMLPHPTDTSVLIFLDSLLLLTLWTTSSFW